MDSISYVFEPSNNRIVALKEEEEIGKVTFVPAGEHSWVVDHTFVHPNHRGQGISQELIRQVVNKALEKDLKIVPLCSFAKLEFDRHPEYQAIELKHEI